MCLVNSMHTRYVEFVLWWGKGETKLTLRSLINLLLSSMDDDPFEDLLVSCPEDLDEKSLLL